MKQPTSSHRVMRKVSGVERSEPPVKRKLGFWFSAVLMLSVVPACDRASAPKDSSPAADAELIARNNEGVGLMGQFKYNEAADVFRELLTVSPDEPDINVNLAIAVLNQQGETNVAEALQILDRVIEANPNHVRANYTAGLLRMFQGPPNDPLPYFLKAAEADESDPAAAYLLGRTYEQASEWELASQWYDRAIQRSPYYASAILGQSRLARQRGDRDAAMAWIEEFQKIKSNPRAEAFEFAYTSAGQHAMAAPIGEPPPPTAIPPGELFDAARGQRGFGNTWQPLAGATLSVCDVDRDGNLDLYCSGVQANGAANVFVQQASDGTFGVSDVEALTRVNGITAVLWGDVDNDGRNDVYFCSSEADQLLLQTDEGGWTAVEDEAIRSVGQRHNVAGAMFDADHDGDLDILVLSSQGEVSLLNNDRDGSFRELADDHGLSSGPSPFRQIVLGDFDNHRDTDLLLLSESTPHALLMNDRLWRYRAEPTAEIVQQPMAAAVAHDVDADGFVDVLALNGDQVTVWTPTPEGTWKRGVSLRLDSPVADALPRLAVADLDGDAVAEVIYPSERGISMVSLNGSRRDLVTVSGKLFAWCLASLDADDGSSLMVLDDSPERLSIARPGPGRHQFVQASFSGKHDKANSLRSNASGIGTQWHARLGSVWNAGTTLLATSGPSQSLQPTNIGLAGHKQIDFMEIVWSDGVFQSELALTPDRPQAITETQRQLSSCPVLFAWNGERFEFVTDVLGVGGIGFMMSPGEYGTPRPREELVLRPEQLAPNQQGRLCLKIGEPMEEACYLDCVQLQAVDLPPSWSLTVDERMGTAPPLPTGAVEYYRDTVAPISAVNDRGEDQLATISLADGTAADVGPIDPRFIGVLAREHQLTVTFAEPIATDRPSWLLIDGWIEYPYSQTMFAAWQADVKYLPPTFEGQAADGSWIVLRSKFAYPAGMPKQMAVPLPASAAGMTKIRIRTNMEIYWDRIRIACTEACAEARSTDLAMQVANVRRCGFAERLTLPQRRPWYDYDRRSDHWDARFLDGFYSRFGPVDDLVAQLDDAVAVFGPGEEAHLEFDATQLPALPAGWTRWYVLSMFGWCKDMDLYTQHGGKLEPMPTRANDLPVASQRDQLHEVYNTRYRGGR